MKIKTVHTVEREHEIELPYYSKSPAHYFKVISENLVLKVCHVNDDNSSIELSHYCIDIAIQAEKCTGQEFNEALKKVQTLLNDKA